MGRRKRICFEGNCTEAAALTGLCLVHYERRELRERARTDAVDAVHEGVPYTADAGVANLAQEFRSLQRWWWRACDGVNYKRSHEKLPLEEAPYAVDWCISLAVELLEAMRLVSSGGEPHARLVATRSWVWDRFWNLQEGRFSNGQPRRRAAEA